MKRLVKLSKAARRGERICRDMNELLDLDHTKETVMQVRLVLGYFELLRKVILRRVPELLKGLPENFSGAPRVFTMKPYAACAVPTQIAERLVTDLVRLGGRKPSDRNAFCKDYEGRLAPAAARKLILRLENLPPFNKSSAKDYASVAKSLLKARYGRRFEEHPDIAAYARNFKKEDISPGRLRDIVWNQIARSFRTIAS